MNKKFYTILILVVIILIIVVLVTGQQEDDQLVQTVKVGAILPFSGPASIWGDSIRKGMDLANEELAFENIKIDIFYEDSRLKPVVSVSAYKKLTNIDKVDIVLSSFSSIGIPLISLADQDKIPLIMTVTSAAGVADQSTYAFRLWSHEKQYVEPHLQVMKNENVKSIATLYRKDEYGESINGFIRKFAKENSFELLIEESFEVGDDDFKTQLMKIKIANPDAIMFVATVPPETINIIKQIRELNLNMKIIEASTTFSFQSVIDGTGGNADGVYSVVYPYSLGWTGNDFKTKYFEKYNEAASVGAAYGYDLVKLLSQSIELNDGAEINRQQLKNNILALQKFDSINGEVMIQSNGEINPVMYSVQIKDGEYIVVE